MAVFLHKSRLHNLLQLVCIVEADETASSPPIANWSSLYMT